MEVLIKYTTLRSERPCTTGDCTATLIKCEICGRVRQNLHHLLLQNSHNHNQVHPVRINNFIWVKMASIVPIDKSPTRASAATSDVTIDAR